MGRGVHIRTLPEARTHSPGASSRGAQLGPQLGEHGARGCAARAHAPRGAPGSQCGRWATHTAFPPAAAGQAQAGPRGRGVCAAKHLPPSPGRKARSGSSEVYRRRAGLRMLRMSARAKGVLAHLVPLASPPDQTSGLLGMQMILWMIAMPHQGRELWGTR